MRNTYLVLCMAIAALSLSSCGKSKPKYQKTPVDKLIVKLMNEPNYSIILADMDYDEKLDSYKHKYRVIIEKKAPQLSAEQLQDSTAMASDLSVETSDWEKVSDITFDRYKNDLGMTIVSKKNGVLNQESSPAGYDNYVGNERYGRWHTTSSGTSFWGFYGRYRFMSDLFYGSSYRYGRSSWDNYDRNYRGRGTAYYGRNNTYGTRGTSASKSSWATKPQTFKDRVRNKVTRSATQSRSRGYSSGSGYSKNSKNNSRYSNRSSSRSRSGGFGK